MLFGLINDLHLTSESPISRVDDVEEVSLDKLEGVYSSFSQTCKMRNEEGIMLIGGDMFDSPRSWWLFPKVAQIINRYKIKTYAVVGQHDSYYYDEKSIRHTNIGIFDLLSQNFKILWSGKKKRIIDEDGKPIANIYGIWYSMKWIDVFEEVIANAKRERNVLNILVAHIPVSTSQDYDFVFPAEKVFAEAKQFDIILVGDIHVPFVLDEKQTLLGKRHRYMVNTGPMMRLDNTEEMKKHSPHFYIFSSDKHHFWQQQIPHRPFLSVFSESFKPKAMLNAEEGAIVDLVSRLREKMVAGYKDPVRIVREMSNQLGQRIHNRKMARLLRQILEESGL